MDFDFIIAPLITLLAGVVLGTVFNFAPVKALKHKIAIIASFAIVSTVALYVISNLYCYNLTSIYLFQSFASMLEGTSIANLLGGYAPFVAAILLTIVFEISLVLSFASESHS